MLHVQLLQSPVNTTQFIHKDIFLSGKSGQRACFLLWQSEFECRRRRLQFFPSKFVIEKNENKQKRGRDGRGEKVLSFWSYFKRRSHFVPQVGLSMDESVTRNDLKDILWIFGVSQSLNEVNQR